jgi:hypothetical protein
LTQKKLAKAFKLSRSIADKYHSVKAA